MQQPGTAERWRGAGRVARRADVATWVYVASLVWWASSWHLRNSVFMAWSPVEPVLVGGVAVALCVLHRLGRPLRVPAVAAVALALLAVSFLPGVLLSSGEGYGPAKVTALVLSLAPVMAAAVLLLSGPDVGGRFVWAQAAVGVAVAAATVGLSDPTVLVSGGRLTLGTVDTIATGRLVGVAVVPLVLGGLHRPGARWLAWPAALGAATVLVQVGSRGPLLAVVVSYAVVVLTSRWLIGRRGRPVLWGAAGVVAMYAYALSGGGDGGQRLLDAVAGDLDTGREPLLAQALDVSAQRPWGIGWGNFAAYSEAGRAVANADGVSYPHNVFAECLVEGGLLVLVVLVGVLLVAFTLAWRASDRLGGALVLGALTFWVVNAQFSSDLLGNRYMWLAVVAALMCGAGRAAPATVAARPVVETVGPK